MERPTSEESQREVGFSPAESTWPEPSAAVEPGWERAVRHHLQHSPEIPQGMVDRLLAQLASAIATDTQERDTANSAGVLGAPPSSLSSITPGLAVGPSAVGDNQGTAVGNPLAAQWSRRHSWQRIAALFVLGIGIPLGVSALLKRAQPCTVGSAIAYTLKTVSLTDSAATWKLVPAEQRAHFPRELRYAGRMDTRPLASPWGRVELTRWKDAADRPIYLSRFPKPLAVDSSNARVLTRAPRTPRALSGGIQVAAWNAGAVGFVLVVPGTVEDYRLQMQLPEEGLALHHAAIR